MMRKTFIALGLLMLLIVQSCTTPPYHPPTPYNKRPAVEQENNLPDRTEPAESPTDPIVSDISQQASHLMRQGQLDAAAQTLERGLRISPKDPSLWSQLATIRLQQHRYEQALSMAAKSNDLAGGNGTIMRRNLLIIEEAQRARIEKRQQ